PLVRGASGQLGAIYTGPRFFRPSAALMHATAAPKRLPGKITPKMEQLRKKFQEKNDKPVFLKGGAMDNIIYRLTWVLCFLGIGGSVHLWLGYIIA
ncbi:hypothetical protein KR054_012474, partial [Drosophila jambulina]